MKTESKKKLNSQNTVDNIRHLKMPERLWKLVAKASKSSRSVNNYIISLIEDDLIKRKMLKKSERKKFQFKNSHFRKRSN